MDIAWFKDKECKDINLTGGKSTNLAIMAGLGLPVPPGFVVTADAYKKFLEETGIAEKIYSLLDNLDVEDSNALHEAAEKIQDIILNAQMPFSIKNEIIEAYENLNVDIDVFKMANKKALDIIKAGREIPYVAVRSSATAEDLPSIDEDSHVFIKVNGKPIYDTIKNIYNKIGDGTNCLIEVASMEDNEVKWIKAKQIYKHPAKNKKLYKITTETGREITITENHSLIILNKDTLKPKIACIKDLKEDEFVPVTRRIDLLNLNEKELDILDYIKGTDIVCENDLIYVKNNSTNWKIQNPLPRKLEINKDLAYFLGIYCAEGCTYKNNGIIITNSNNKALDRVKRFLKKISLYNNQIINKHSIRVYCKSLVRLLHKLTGKPLQFKGKGRACRIKQVPNFIFGCNKEIIGSFLAGCFDGDGYIHKEMIEYCSTSKKLIGGIVKLLEMLDISFYIRKKNAFNINIPNSQANQFRDLIKLENVKKLERLNKLIENYNKKGIHQEFLNNQFLISNKLSKNIKEDFDNSLEKTNVEIGICPLCDKKIEKTSYNKNKLRFYCKNCKKVFYENDIKKKFVEKYVYYDEKGRFKKSMVPWNKGLLKRERLSRNKFRRYMESYRLNDHLKFFNGSILWDKIRKVEEVDYSGDVYDFTVPGVENFAAGVGGIITHNTASFAGQQATFLNVRGAENVAKAVQKCIASLFTARAIYYRIKNNFEHRKVYIAVIVQKMVNSDKAGVIFTANPSTNNQTEILIEAGFGLGEVVVGGKITPDTYIVDKETLEIKSKKINVQKFSIIRDINLGRNVRRNLFEDEGGKQKLSESEIIKLAKYAREIENHYQKPQDLEFAIEGSKIYIVQTRAITTLQSPYVHEEERAEKPEPLKEVEVKDDVILEGLAASPYVGSGPVKIVLSMDELDKVEEGDILVTEMTDPDFTPTMKKVNGIVTNSGGSTSHASIVSREMGKACVVGTLKATEVLNDGDIVTVDGVNGKVYRGEHKVKVPEEVFEKVKEKIETITKVKVNLDMPEYAEKAATTNADGVGLLRCEFLILGQKEHPYYMIKQGRKDELVSSLAEGIRKIAKAFEGKPVWYRTLDAPTDEFRKLEGGENEPEEENPMMGWRSIRRDLDQPELLKAQFEAIKRLHDEGYTNVGVMIPLVTHVEQVRKAKEILKEVGLEALEEIEFGVMVETPAAVEIIEDLCEEGLDFISFGTNDLTQFTLAVDRNNAKVQKIFDELHPAVLKQIERVIKVCREHNVETSICGQAGSNEEMAEWLVKKGIDSISANIDAVKKIKYIVYKTEKKMLLDVARERMEE